MTAITQDPALALIVFAATVVLLLLVVTWR
jgi:hypothetical protein